MDDDRLEALCVVAVLYVRGVIAGVLSRDLLRLLLDQSISKEVAPFVEVVR